MRLRVIGIGTPQGDDAAGLAIAERLEAAGLAGVEVCTCQRPGVDLLDALDGAAGVVIVDAMRGGGRPGRVRRVSAEELDRGAAVSTHVVGVAGALALARALGRCPARVELVGVEAGPGDGPELSGPVQRAVDGEATALVRELLAEMAREAGYRRRSR